MTKKQLREWRNRLIFPILTQFSGLTEKKNKKLRKLMEENMDFEIKYYRSLLSKKERKQMDLQSVSAPPVQDSQPNMAEPDR